jgi:hypothetical protein
VTRRPSCSGFELTLCTRGRRGLVVTYPFDVVRRRLQVDAMPGSPYVYTGVRNAFATIWKREGV